MDWRFSRWMRFIFGNKTSTSTIFYVSGRGHDDNDGKHPLRAWRSIDRLNHAKHHIKEKDQILFQRDFDYRGIPFYWDNPKYHTLSVGAYGSGMYPRFPDCPEPDVDRLKEK